MGLTTIVNKNTAHFHYDYDTELKLNYYICTIHIFYGSASSEKQISITLTFEDS